MRYGLVGMCGAMLLASAQAYSQTTRSWSMAEFGEPLYEESMPHWPYVNPDAPKGGSIVLDAFGTFDSLNTIILKGTWPRSLGHASDTLMVNSADELSSAYGLIAKSAEYPDDKSWVVFHLRPQAQFNDGTPITAADFEFAFQAMRDYGRPFLKSFFEEVASVEVLDEHRLKYNFSTRDTMKPLLKVAGLSPQSKAYWSSRDISKTYLTPAPASGPYYVFDVDAGRSITYKRVENYWGAALNVNAGTSNIETIRYDYYRDMEVMLEAFKAGDIDFRAENSSKRWSTGYDIAAVTKGDIVRETPADNTPSGIQAFFFNLRRAPFDDIRVRQAFNLLYDFETIRRTILYNQYTRINSFFPNSDFGASGAPTDAELALLEPYREQLPPAPLQRALCVTRQRWQRSYSTTDA